MLSVESLTAGYGETPVLDKLSFTAAPGEITAILGPNGCGKSTLLKAMAGLLSQVKGQVYLDGQPVMSMGQKQIAQRICYLPQNRQTPDITVGRLVLHGRFPYLNYPRRYSQKDRLIAQEAIEKMGIPELSDVALNRLSGGQQQKAYIAMALAQDTPVIALDEPTTYLDISHQQQLFSHARQLASEGKYVFVVTHDVTWSLEHADRLLVMDAGKIIADGAPEQVYEGDVLQKLFRVEINRAQVGEKWRYLIG